MSLTPLTDDQYAHVEEAWRLFDTDGDGLVTPKDLQAILRTFGYEHSLVVGRCTTPPARHDLGQCGGAHSADP